MSSSSLHSAVGIRGSSGTEHCGEGWIVPGASVATGIGAREHAVGEEGKPEVGLGGRGGDVRAGGGQGRAGFMREGRGRGLDHGWDLKGFVFVDGGVDWNRR